MTETVTPPKGSGARERVLEAAYHLFTEHGIQAVGVDQIVAEAGVAKATLYRHFPSKDDLAVAALERRQHLWTSEWLHGQINRNGGSPGARMLAIFEAFDMWFARTDFESCFFISSLLESHDRASKVGAASVEGLENVLALITGVAKDAGVKDPEGFARQWQILMSGSIICATLGDAEAAQRARDVGRLLLERHGIAPDQSS